MRIKKPRPPKTVLARNYSANRRGDVAEMQKLAPKVQKLRSTAPKSTSTGIRRPRKPSV